MLRTIAITASLVLTGCDVVNCVVNNHPEFSKNSVNSATLNQVYEDTIRVSISNSFEDNDYSYTFDLDGPLPSGISYEISSREVLFTGTPTELGDFPFRLSVVAAINTSISYAGGVDEPEELCSDTESRDIVFSVVQ